MASRFVRDAFERGSDRHQRRHITPQMERTVVEPRAPYPFLSTAHVLHDERDVSACGFACLCLDAKARIE